MVTEIVGRVRNRLIGDDQRPCVLVLLFFNCFFLFRSGLIYTQGVFEGKRAGVVAGIGGESRIGCLVYAGFVM